MKKKSTFDKGFVGKLKEYNKIKHESPYIPIMRDTFKIWNNKDAFSYISRSSSRGLGPFSICQSGIDMASEWEFRLNYTHRKFNEKLLDKVILVFDQCHRCILSEVESCRQLFQHLETEHKLLVEKEQRARAQGQKSLQNFRVGSRSFFEDN